MLKSAFDEGWQGYQDLRDPTAEQILEDWCEDYKKKRLKETGMTPVMDVEIAPTQGTFQFNDTGHIVVNSMGTFVEPEEWHTQQQELAVESRYMVDR